MPCSDDDSTSLHVKIFSSIHVGFCVWVRTSERVIYCKYNVDYMEPWVLTGDGRPVVEVWSMVVLAVSFAGRHWYPHKTYDSSTIQLLPAVI